MNNRNVREDTKEVYKECFICHNGKETKLNKTWYRMITIHHILPKSKNGSDQHANLISLCRGCHDAYHEYLSKLHIHLTEWSEFQKSLINFKILLKEINKIQKLFKEYDANKNDNTLRKIYDIMANTFYKITYIPDDIDPSNLYDVYLKLIRIERIARRYEMFRFGYLLEYPKNSGFSAFTKRQ